jgi:hypothetical protein
MCVFGGRNHSLMMETADLTVRMLSITGVRLEVGGLNSSSEIVGSNPTGECVDVSGCFLGQQKGRKRC